MVWQPSSIAGVGDGWDWDDSYEVDLEFANQDFRDVALAIDMEDYHVAFDDNMGDYLDQGSTPLVLAPDLLKASAYCTATYYNPSSKPRDSDYALVPSSILWMEIAAKQGAFAECGHGQRRRTRRDGAGPRRYLHVAVVAGW